MTKETGLEVLQASYVELLTFVGMMAAPYVTPAHAEAVIREAMKRGLNPDGTLRVESLIRVLAMSKSTFYRTSASADVDQYSVLEKIADVLCPRYPEWLPATQILQEIAEFEPDLSLRRLIEILDHFVGMGFFEVDQKQYRLHKALTWVDDQFIRRDQRARKSLPIILRALDGYIKGVPDCELGTLGLRCTREEFLALIHELKAFLNDWLARHGGLPDAQSSRSFVISILTTPAEGLDVRPLAGAQDGSVRSEEGG